MGKSNRSSKHPSKCHRSCSSSKQPAKSSSSALSSRLKAMVSHLLRLSKKSPHDWKVTRTDTGAIFSLPPPIAAALTVDYIADTLHFRLPGVALSRRRIDSSHVSLILGAPTVPTFVAKYRKRRDGGEEEEEEDSDVEGEGEELAGMMTAATLRPSVGEVEEMVEAWKVGSSP